METMDPKKLEFPQESHVGRRKWLRPAASQRGSLSTRRRFHTVLTFFENTLQDSLEPREQ